MDKKRLSSYNFQKGKFIAHFNEIPNMKTDSWATNRMPEYLWMGLVIEYFGREVGLLKLRDVFFKFFREFPMLDSPKLSSIFALESKLQERLLMILRDEVTIEPLSCLTIFLTSTVNPIFSNIFYDGSTVENRLTKLTSTMKKLSHHQSDETTDVKFSIITFYICYERMQIPESFFLLLNKYHELSHSHQKMPKYRASIRAAEQGLVCMDETNNIFLDEFWRCVSEMSECELNYFSFPEENRDLTLYMESVYEVLRYLSDTFVSVVPLDEKMKVILGISTYAYKRLQEINSHNMFNSIAGRSCVRVLIESYIMLKYLIKSEPMHPDIWREYQSYGLGQYKTVLEKHRDNPTNSQCHFTASVIESLVNEFINEAFVDMDTGYFNSQNIRMKAQFVDEEILYGLYYDYDSAFEHGLWGAIRETSFLKCENPAHGFHNVPDLDNLVNSASVMFDCVMVMNKIVSFLDEQFSLPVGLVEGVLEFELNN